MEQTQARRKKLMNQLPPNAVVVLYGATKKTRNNDVHYPFRQNSNFAYLTGFNEPDAIAVLRRDHFCLFVHPKDKTMEMWEGHRTGPECAMSDYNANSAFALDAFEAELENILAETDAVFFPLNHDITQTSVQSVVTKLKKQNRAGEKAPRSFHDIEPFIAQMRLLKEEDEINLMRHAAKVSAHAHTDLMKTCRAGLTENQLHARLLYLFKYYGGEEAYSSIIAGGKNACILHYTENNQPLKQGDLLLVDAGMEHQGYAADITRTFPVTGLFSEAQKTIYEIVLHAQKAAIEACYENNTFNDPHQAAINVMTAGLIDIGLLDGTLEENIEKQNYSRFFMHRTGHWLGMDVHDVGAYKNDEGDWVELQPGMVLTIEPGLYIPDEHDIPVQYRNIGVRIEDDILITEDGHENLTQDVVKTVADIEDLMRD